MIDHSDIDIDVPYRYPINGKPAPPSQRVRQHSTSSARPPFAQTACRSVHFSAALAISVMNDRGLINESVLLIS